MNGRVVLVFQIHIGTQHNVLWPGNAGGLGTEFTTFPEKLQEAGYMTHLVGKWHLGNSHTKYLPTQRGFHHFYGNLNMQNVCLITPFTVTAFNNRDH